METKVQIVTKKENILLESIIYLFERERIEYQISDSINQLEDITNIICLGYDESLTLAYVNEKEIPIIIIEDQKKIIKNDSGVINYIITNLFSDDTIYTSVQKDYLFQKGAYAVFLEKVLELLNNNSNYNGMIYDLTEIKTIPKDWVFHFESIRDTYDWLLKKNDSLPDNLIRKGINFYSEMVYDDSLREINYLTQKLVDIKNKKRSIDLFICTKEELHKFSNNYFFKMLLKNISSTYQIYFINRVELEEKESDLVSKLLDGVAIYDDCVYRDTYDDENSLGFVDCNQKTVEEYNRYFDYIMNTYGNKINMDGDIDELL